MKKIEQAHWKQAHRLIMSARLPLLVCHIAPDGDAVGSLTGLGYALRQMGQEPTLACSDPISDHFDYIPGVKSIVQDIDKRSHSFFDLVIALDCSDIKRIGHFAQTLMPGNIPLLNIDHHPTNPSFGDVNLVDSQASSTAEVVLRLLEHMDASLDADLATCLLTGIVSDTRGFSTSNVTTQVMEAALRLMRAGASLPYIAYHTLNRRSTTAILLWGAALDTVQIEDRVIWTSITQNMRRSVGYVGNGDAGLASFLISAAQADAAVVFVEREDGSVEVGMRAMPGFDVAKVAIRFGGGGHTLAAGCNLPGPLMEAQARVLADLRASLSS